ncbi:MAG TPA: response regulator [Burkholderiales bacterium]|nr:response regulator [Burkholderiales bacterium]
MARILVVDDAQDIRSLLSAVLTMDGHRVQVAQDGDAALKIQRTTPADLLVTDIFMPNKDGMETIAAFRGEFPGVKIIAVSGGPRQGRHDYLKVALEIGADVCLLKPFGIEELSKTIRSLLR